MTDKRMLSALRDDVERTYPRGMPRWLAILALVLSACGGATETAPTAKPGNPDVYARIDAMTDCAALQAEFEQASTNHGRATDLTQRKAATGYMEAAEARRQALNC